MTDKLQQLVELCKCGVYVSVNQHRDYYETAEQYLNNDLCEGRMDDLTPEMRARMVATNTIVEVQFYPRTPIGFHLVLDVGLSDAIDRALVIAQGL